MRRATLELLQCPRCRRGQLLPDTDTPEVLFGPVRCTACQTSYPMAEGVLDLEVGRTAGAGVQWGFEQHLFARSYEQLLRPAIQLLFSRQAPDRESEYVLYRALFGSLEGPVLDLGCGTGLFARRLAREPGIPAVIGMDVSKPMIEEAVAQAREAGLMVDFLRAGAPALPFQDGALGGILHSRGLHYLPDLTELFHEVRRTLRPGGRYVASTYLPPSKLPRMLHRRAGLYPRALEELQAQARAAGLERFERMTIPPFVVIKAEQPRT